MRILIGKTVLAGKWRESVQNFKYEGGPVIQEAEFFRGSTPTFFNRGNTKMGITFTVERTHASTVEAQLFCLDHMWSAPKKDVVTFIATDGTRDAARYAYGVLRNVGGEFIGMTTRTNYQLTISTILKNKPAAA